ncbi:hypothetical protein CISIN_1g034671mg [Citrus sinensis]|uniref:Uncharacterized protein n=1 Tax=Citrus sinensis TaxID=2711 RepID=A0A067EQC0_CITSI|nr:hypothetical protein CISIN_1g034671mg [Citrus sinensis]
MAGAGIFLSKRVQELVLNGEEPPASYICRDGDSIQEVSAPLSPVPIIDLSLLSSSTLCAKQEEELHKLRSLTSVTPSLPYNKEWLFI